MKKYEINKYPPSLFKAGRFLREDWTACTDIGHATPRGTLSKEEYLRVEGLYVAVIDELACTVAPAAFQVHGLEFWEHEKAALTNLGLDDVLDESPVPEEGERVTGSRLKNIVRRCLREVAWLELVVKPRLLVHFGYDLRLIVAAASPLTPVLEQARVSGLFVYDSEASLPTLDTWPLNT